MKSINGGKDENMILINRQEKENSAYFNDSKDDKKLYAIAEKQLEILAQCESDSDVLDTFFTESDFLYNEYLDQLRYEIESLK